MKKPQPNIEIIKALMKSRKQRGNPKNFVVVSGSTILDYAGTYNLMYKDKDGESQEAKTEGVGLYHKRDLCRLFGEEIGSKFWNRKTSTRRRMQ